jgi:hypothetical protein
MLLLAPLAIVGCGTGNKKPVATATGKVTLDGAPLANSSIVFNYDDGSTHSIGIKDDGSFKDAKTPLGKATVTFFNSASDPTRGEEMQRIMATMKGGPAAGKKMLAFVGRPIPEKYTKVKTSGFTWEITTGSNEKTFELKAD